MPRTIEVAPARLPGWLDGFAERHGPSRALVVDGALRLDAPDGSHAVCSALLAWAPDGPAVPEGFAAHAAHVPPVVLLLVRRGGYGVGLLQDGRLVVSKVGSRYVQSRTAAGGWSQQRFARRRDNQAAALLDATAAVTATLVLGADGRSAPAGAVVVTGGDRALTDRLLADRRLTSLAGLVRARHLDVGDPRAAVLRTAAERAITVRIAVHNA